MTGAELILYLLARDILQPADVVHGSARIISRPRDRFNLHELSVGGRTLAYIKELRSASGRPYLDAEIAALGFLGRHQELATMAPRCLAIDGARGLLVTAAAEGQPATELRDPDFVDALAHRLAALHNGTRTSGAGGPTPDIIGEVPWVLRLFGGGDDWRPRALALVWPLVTNQARMRQAASEAIRIWTRTSLIHGDIKWEHCFLNQRHGERTSICLVDWELSGVGDAAWDVAAALAELLVVNSPADASGAAVDASSPLERFMSIYLDRAGAFTRDRAFVRRATLLAAFRTFQTSLEHATADPRNQGAIRALVQRAEWILASREAMADSLLARQR